MRDDAKDLAATKKQWHCVQPIADQIWAQWLKSICPCCRDEANGSEHTPCGVWPIGLVVDVKTSADGLVRSAKVRTRNDCEVSHPVTKLVLLEAHEH